MSKLRFRSWTVVTTLIAATLAVMAGVDSFAQQPESSALTEAELGAVLKKLNLDVTKNDKRFDFQFQSAVNGESWDLSMSTVLSQNGRSLWVMALLDKIPNSAAQVPRNALLRLLAANDRMGNGKFFAYIPANKRFVLQRVVPNDQLNSTLVDEILKDLAASVVDTYPQWNVANWSKPSSTTTRTSTQDIPHKGGVIR